MKMNNNIYIKNEYTHSQNNLSDQKTCLQAAHADGMSRLLQAFIREKLVKFLYANNMLIILLEQSGNVLLIEEVSALSLDRYIMKGKITLWNRKKNFAQKIECVENLLTIFSNEFSKKIELKNWSNLITEVKNNINNTALTIKHTQQWHEKISHHAKKNKHETLWAWVRAGHAGIDTALFFEQWATQGHPNHPCNKTKLGFTEQDVLNYAPEFQPEVPLRLNALHKDCVHVELQTGISDYQAWFAENYSEWWDRWCTKLHSEKLSIEEYVPFPVHPWQQSHKIPEYFSELIQAGKLHLFEEVNQIASPTLSFRTLATVGDKQAPHIKLSVSVQATSTMRTVSAASIQNGPKVSLALQKIVQQENYFDGKFRMLNEMVGLHVKGFPDDISKNFSALFRANPNSQINHEEMAITIAALFAISPVRQIPFCIELMEMTGVKNAKEACAYFRQYVDIVLRSHLDLYLQYGVALEAHQQNTIAVFEDGYPIAMLARDFAGARMHKATLNNKGFDLAIHPGSVTVTDDRIEVRNKILHSVYQMHFGEWTHLLAEYYGVSETLFWEQIKIATEERFIQLKDKLEPKFWEQERAAFLIENWPFKALFSMRLINSAAKYVYTSVQNPLVEEI